MAQQADREFVEMSLELRQEISTALLQLVDALNLLVQLLFRELTGSTESRAAKFLAKKYEATSQGPDPVNSALRSILFSVLAGLDHVRLFAVGLVSERPAFGMATLTRGAVEAYSRAWWLLHSESGDDLLIRWLSGRSKELSMTIRVNPNAVLSVARPKHDSRGTTATCAR